MYKKLHTAREFLLWDAVWIMVVFVDNDKQYYGRTNSKREVDQSKIEKQLVHERVKRGHLMVIN